jgi:dolichol-phosphate mannosyltransferase
LRAKAKKDRRIRALRFSRNFGFQKSILINYHSARGDAAIQIAADMHDPPELISDFLRLWEKGYKVVYGVRKNRRENICLRYFRHLFYRIVNRVSDCPVPVSAGDF